MTDLKIRWYEKFDADDNTEVYPYTHLSNYECKHLPETINRNGIFKYLEDTLYSQVSDSALSIHQAAHFLDNPQKTVYRINAHQEKAKKDNLLIAIYLDEIFQPGILLRDSLKKLVLTTDIEQYSNVYLHVEYGIKTLKGKNIEYLHSFLQAFGEITGKVPVFTKYPDLLKKHDMRDWDYYEGNLIWYYSDSFLKHFCLSKGAGLIETPATPLFEEKKTLKLSPYHSISFGQLKEKVGNEKLALARKIGAAFFNERKDPIRGEKHLLYKFLYGN